MDRRDFLKFSMAAAGAAATGGCSQSLSASYQAPKGLARKNEILLLKNCNIIDTISGKLKAERNIMLKDGIILDLIHDQNLSNICPARSVDLKNQYVMPGIINGHCHIVGTCGIGSTPGFFLSMKRQTVRNAEECIKHGVTTVRDTMAMIGWMDELKKKIEKNEIVGPDIISSCVFARNDGYSKQVRWLTPDKYWKNTKSPIEAKEAFEKFKDENTDFIKIFLQRNKLTFPGDPLPIINNATIKTICDTAQKNGTSVAAHLIDFEGFQDAINAGVSTFEHMVSDRVLSGKDMEEGIEKLIASGSYIIPTICVPFAFTFEKKGDPHWGKGDIPSMVKIRDRLIEKIIIEYSEPEIAEVNIKRFKKFQNPRTFEKRHFLPVPNLASFNAGAHIAPQNLRLLYDAGVNFGCGNDGGVPFLYPGAMGLEMGLLEELGIKTKDVLKMATINNAMLLSRENRIGSIDIEKDADIAVFKNNPLESVWNLMKPKMVFKKGRLLYSA